MSDKFCPACGDPVPEHAQVCKSCKHLVNATMPCRACRHLIAPQAEKCTHCDAFQDWRRWFGMSSTVVASLTALISVIGLIVTTASTVRPQSATRAAIVGGTREALTVAVVNSGNAASVARDKFTMTVDDDVLTIGRLTVKKDEEAKRLLKSRDATVLTVYVDSITRNPAANEKDFWRAYGRTPVRLKGVAMESDGSRTVLKDKVTLDDIRILIEGKCDPCRE